VTGQKTILSSHLRVDKQARKNDAPGAGSRSDSAAAIYLFAGIGNRGIQRLLETHPEMILRSLAAGNPLTLNQVMREPGDRTRAARRARSGNGTVTVTRPHYDPYDVTGETLEEISTQLDPEEWGSCATHYTYTYSATEGQTDRVNVTVTRTIRLPRWRGAGYRRASQAARQEWQRMLQALRRHENHHAEIGQSWGTTIREGLLNQDETTLDDTMTRLEGDAQKAQDDYDTETDHGQNEGVTLDLSIE
jgi:predicted secreted Zn-dependent protease